MKEVISIISFIIGIALVFFGIHPMGNKLYDFHLVAGFVGWLLLLYSFYCSVPTYDAESKDTHQSF